MKSPFPGMDPFIEGCGLWEDFHGHLVEDICRYLADSVPDRYVVRGGERNYLVLADEETPKQHQFKPDVSIHSSGTSASRSAGAVAVAEPTDLTMQALVEEEFRETFVEILELGSPNRLVTSIEVLSPSNKRTNTVGWDQYLRKRQGLLHARVANLVEIDLLRGGQRMPLREPWPDSPYTMLIARADRMPACQVKRAHFRTPLPILPVPLLQPDPDVSVDLQPMIHATFARAKYSRSIDYTSPISPSLSEGDAVWLEQQLHARAES